MAPSTSALAPRSVMQSAVRAHQTQRARAASPNQSRSRTEASALITRSAISLPPRECCKGACASTSGREAHLNQTTEPKTNIWQVQHAAVSLSLSVGLVFGQPMGVAAASPLSGYDFPSSTALAPARGALALPWIGMGAGAPPRQQDSISLLEWKERRQAPEPREQQPQPQQRGASTKPVREQVQDVQRLTSEAQQATQAGDFEKALELYSEIVSRYPDLAMTDYSRLSRGLMLFQTGQRSNALLELEDLEFTFKGSAELAAALSAAIYTEHPNQLAKAESEWRIVDGFDKRYYDLSWVESEKQWPPMMVDALRRFLRLQ